MNISERGMQLIMESEGCVLTAYPDPGTGGAPWTIGYGDTGNVVEGQTITQEEADARLARRMPYYEHSVESMVKVPLTQGQFDALVDFAYNLGSDALRSSTLMKKLNAGDYAGAAAEFGKWVLGGNGHVLPGLVTRRAKERALFEARIEEGEEV